MADPTCAICKRPGRARIVEADVTDGLKPAAVAATMRDVGWALTAADVVKHMTHAVTRHKSAATRKRDAAVTLREQLMDEVDRRIASAESRANEATEECARGEHEVDDHPRYRSHGPRVHEPTEFFDPLNKDLQAAFGTIIKAEGVVAKRENEATKRKIDLFALMLGGAGADGLAPDHLLGDGSVIEGDYVEAD